VESKFDWSMSVGPSRAEFTSSVSSDDGNSSALHGAAAGTAYGICSGYWAGKWAGRVSGIYYPVQSSFSANPITQENMMRFMKLGMLKGARNGGCAGFLATGFFVSRLYAAGYVAKDDDRKKTYRFVNSAALAGTISGALTGILAGGVNGTVIGAATGIALAVMRRS